MSDIDKITDAILDDDLLEVERLINEENINEFNSYLITPLMLAAHYGRYYIVKSLIEHGADINLCSPDDGYSAFLDALRENYERVALYLSENGADIMVEGTQDGNTPLQYAIDYGMLDIANKLLDKNCKITGTNDMNVRVFDMVCERGYVDIMMKLLKMGADINNKSTDSLTPLIRAIAKNHPKVVYLLLEAGADLTIADSNNNTPFDIALDKEDDTIAKIMRGFMIEKNIDPNCVSNNYTFK